ncbi:MAG TPA: hypothetical protein PKA64_23305, partial [Myxococcota bacterium]|nr:hypothetical protein [Myxococcota bacterium]
PLPGREGDPEAPVVTEVLGPATFINGATVDFTVTTDAIEPLAGVIVQFPGYDGSFFVPVDAPGARAFAVGGLGFQLHVPSDWFQNDSRISSIIVRALDRLDRRGPPVERPLTGQEVGEGDVQIGITWGSPTDVDLHVVEPSGEEISYASRLSSTGGQLDLDSNPACNIDGVNAEHVFWPAGASPAGSYTARVELYSACEQAGASGTVTITHCGPDSPLTAPFTLTAGAPSASWTFESACAARVSGDVTWEDFVTDVSGPDTEGRLLPGRYLTVQVRRASDDALLATGFTDARGHYAIDLSNPGPPGYRVELVARGDGIHTTQEVQTLRSHVYTWRNEEVFDETVLPDNVVDIDITAFKSGGALNIFDVGVRAEAVARAGGVNVPKLVWKWTLNKRPEGGNVSFYRAADQAIYVYSDPADEDAFDDMVLGHEYGHFIHNTLGLSSSPGGPHSSNERSDPRLAWSEGWATWFSTQANRWSWYVDTNALGVNVAWHLDRLSAYKPLGNEGDRLDGKLSEAVVAATLYDLVDDTNEFRDTITNGQIGVWTTLVHGMASHADRGHAGTDLVDFYDAWICGRVGDVGTDDFTGLRGNAVGLHKLSYDFAPVCR